MRLYLVRKLITYSLTAIAAVTVDWIIPHAMPGDPIKTLLARFAIRSEGTYQSLYHTFARSFRTDLPLWKQYYYFWVSLFHGDLGLSIDQFPTTVTTIIGRAAPYTLGLLVPAIVLSFYVGNKLGAFAARRKTLDNTVLPISYLITATPYMWAAMLIAWLLAYKWSLFPGLYGYDVTLKQSWSWRFIISLLDHWFLPFFTLFLIGLGGWAIGMRNMIIFELESDYSHYLEALGAPQRLIRKYAFRNALLPQITGLALALGAVIGGALVTEIVFNYPGLGSVIFRAIQNKDYFLIQGVFLFIILGILVANFCVDIVYMIIDPRTRIGMQGGQA
ncbi:MAG: ABC transporter permease [Gaiellaceae bacterium]